MHSNVCLAAPRHPAHLPFSHVDVRKDQHRTWRNIPLHTARRLESLCAYLLPGSYTAPILLPQPIPLVYTGLAPFYGQSRRNNASSIDATSQRAPQRARTAPASCPCVRRHQRQVGISPDRPLTGEFKVSPWTHSITTLSIPRCAPGLGNQRE